MQNQSALSREGHPPDPNPNSNPNHGDVYIRCESSRARFYHALHGVRSRRVYANSYCRIRKTRVVTVGPSLKCMSGSTARALTAQRLKHVTVRICRRGDILHHRLKISREVHLTRKPQKTLRVSTEWQAAESVFFMGDRNPI